jgi:PAS domain S-box-containing protein
VPGSGRFEYDAAMNLQAALERLRDYETVIDTMNCGLVGEDLDSTIVFANKRLLEWCLYEKEEVEGQHVSMLVPPELWELMDDDTRTVRSGDMRARLLAMRRKDGTTFPVVGIPQTFLNASGELDAYFYIIVDLGAVLTAKAIGNSPAMDIRTTLSRIGMELQSICLAAGASGMATVPLHHPELHALSPREIEVLSLLVSGDRVPSIAERLHISQHTVRNHLKSMYRKLEVGNQAGLIERVRKLSRPADAEPAANA